MKRMKKFAGLLLALVMVFSLTVTAFAEGTNTITVNGAQANETYEIYKMFDLIVNEDKTAYSYTVNEEWSDFFTTGAGKDYVNIDNQGYVTWKSEKEDGASMETFGKAAAAVVEGKTEAVEAITPTADGSFTFSGLEAGYYLITSTNGTLAMVDTTPTNPDATINEKNPDPTIDKQVQEDSTEAWGKDNSAQIGDTVNFKVIINVKKGAKNYVMHDKMDDALSFDANSVKVEGLNAGTDYNVVTTGICADCDFHIVFTESYLNGITEDKALTVTYSATLNEGAKVDTDIKNDTQLSWGDASNTEWSETVTKTYKFEVLKYAAIDSEKNPLAGATFQLKDVNGKVIKLIKISDTEYRVANGDEANAVESFTTVDSGNIVISGVDLDKYTLTETEAPAGYNKLKDPVDVVVGAENNLVIEVPNNAGTELPNTGGIGGYVFDGDVEGLRRYLEGVLAR